MRNLIPERAPHVVVGYPPTYQSRVCANERRRRIIGTIVLLLFAGVMAFATGYFFTKAWNIAVTSQVRIDL